MIKARL
jgi:cytochrome P450